MKIKLLMMSGAISVALAGTSVLAVPINITMSGSSPCIGSSQIVANNISPSNCGDRTVLNWLRADVNAYNSTYFTSYAPPITGAGNVPTEGHPAVGRLLFYSFYGPKQQSVPDGGATVLLLGLTLSVTGLIRRKLS